MPKDKNRIWVRFSVEDSDTEMYEYLRNIPIKHRAWVAKKLFLDKLKNLKDITIATTSTANEKNNEQQLNSITQKNSATLRKIPIEF